MIASQVRNACTALCKPSLHWLSFNALRSLSFQWSECLACNIVGDSIVSTSKQQSTSAC